MIEHRLRLSSERHFGRRPPPAPVGIFLQGLPRAVQQAVAMRLIGRSNPSGKRPGWLDRAADIRFLGLSADEGDGTTLVFEAPRLQDFLPDGMDQLDLFKTHPSPADTGLDLLGDVLLDVQRRNKESDLYDPPLLKQVGKLRAGMDGAFQEAELWGSRLRRDQAIRIDRSALAGADELAASTPAPKPTRVSGKLDMIRASTLGFALALEGGEEVRGVLQTGDANDLGRLFRKDVVAIGRAVFRPSGGLLRVDAEMIVPAAAGDRFFSKVPVPSGRLLAIRDVIRAQPNRGGVAAIVGNWPGDESDEVIAAALGTLR